MEIGSLIEPDVLKVSDEPLVIIDTRAPEAYAQGHLPGAFNMRDIFTYLATSTPHGLLDTQNTFAALFGAIGLSGKERAVVYEDSMDNGFGQSCRGYYLLKYLGYKNASVLHGGLQGWRAAGFPTRVDVPALPVPAVFPLSVDKRLMVTKQEMVAALTDPHIVKLDVRDPPEWNGLSATPSGHDPVLRVGRIPGAQWIEWQKLLDPEAEVARFLPAEEIRTVFEQAGIGINSSLYIYCYKGSRAANTFVALQQAGFENARIYFASWNEWGRDLDLPVEVDPQVAYAL